jgi:hypothetical protein
MRPENKQVARDDRFLFKACDLLNSTSKYPTQTRNLFAQNGTPYR